jgi:hypothetical protein
MAGKQSVCLGLALGLTLGLAAGASWAGGVPEAVSPGLDTGIGRVAGVCPTFSWAGVQGAEAYELVVYEARGVEGETAQRAVATRIPGAASSWTPSVGKCLAPGEQYVWFVRAVGAKGSGEWSEGRVFEVAMAPTMPEVEQALAVLQRYLGSGGVEEDDPRLETVPVPARDRVAGDLPSGAQAGDETVAPALGGADFSIDASGNVAGASFAGDGSGLTELDASSITTGTLAESRIDALMARDNEILPAVFAGDGSGSGLDADLLDGQEAAAFASTSHLHSGGDITSGTVVEPRIDALMARDSEILPAVLAGDGSGSGLDADLLDGKNSSVFSSSEHDHAYAHVIEVPLEFGSIQDAIDSVTDASSENRSLVRVASGVYPELVTMKTGVDVEGSGINETKITAPGGAFATVQLAVDSELRWLTVENTGGGGVQAIAIKGRGACSDIRVTASGGQHGNFGIWPTGEITMQHVDVELTEGGVGILNEQTVGVVEDSTVTVSGGGTGIVVSTHGSITVRRTSVSASGGSSIAVALGPRISSAAPFIIEQSVLDGGSGLGLSVSEGAYAMVSSTVIEGGIGGSHAENLSCVAVYERTSIPGGESFAPLNHRCLPLPAGSTADADTLDGKDSTQFLRGDTSDSYHSGTFTFQSGTTLDVAGALDLPAAAISGAGPGSGLNADLLDGSHASAFMPAGTDNWVNVTGDTMTNSVVGDETLSVVKGSGNPPSSAALGVMNTTSFGEAGWFRLTDPTNNLPVVMLVLDADSNSTFLKCERSGTKCHIDKDGTFHAGSDRGRYEPGDVLVMTVDGSAVEMTGEPYSPRVAGVYSTRPGFLGADKNGETRVDDNDVPVAIVGIVPTKVSAENGPIGVGDLLVSASTPGHAMKGTDQSLMHGAVVGKALEPLAGGTGVIRVLVSLL